MVPIARVRLEPGRTLRWPANRAVTGARFDTVLLLLGGLALWAVNFLVNRRTGTVVAEQT